MAATLEMNPFQTLLDCYNDLYPNASDVKVTLSRGFHDSTGQWSAGHYPQPDGPQFTPTIVIDVELSVHEAVRSLMVELTAHVLDPTGKVAVDEEVFASAYQVLYEKYAVAAQLTQTALDDMATPSGRILH